MSSPSLDRTRPPPDQSPDQRPRKRMEPRERGVMKSNAYGLPHAEVLPSMSNPSPAKRTRASDSNQPPPIALSEAQMCALLAASYPLPATARSAFLEHCAREIALASLHIVASGKPALCWLNRRTNLL
jgi:hypothetical protein